MKAYLKAQAEKMGVPMTDAQADAFCAYHDRLTAANREMNLTRVGEDAQEAVDRNYLDSLTILPFLGGVSTLIDVGTGAGFPGVPVAIMRPDIHVTLMDALGKRVAFLKEVVAALGLNADCVHARCEDAAKKPEFRDAYDVACARAVAETNVLSEWLLPFVKPGGAFIAMKGPDCGEELGEASKAISALGGKLERCAAYTIPGTDITHSLVIIRKMRPTPPKYPRRWAQMKKHPL